MSAEGGAELGPPRHQPERASSCSTFLFIAVGGRVRDRPAARAPQGANSPYGGLGLIALFSGFFIMMGFLWAVIGE